MTGTKTYLLFLEIEGEAPSPLFSISGRDEFDAVSKGVSFMEKGAYRDMVRRGRIVAKLSVDN